MSSQLRSRGDSFLGSAEHHQGLPVEHDGRKRLGDSSELKRSNTTAFALSSACRARAGPGTTPYDDINEEPGAP